MLIVIATHKEKPIVTNSILKPIQVNSLLASYDISEICLLDSKGENISIKNKNYCELTALYWVWKNTNEDIVGLMHYRRFFNILLKTIIKPHRVVKVAIDSKKILKLNTQEEIIKKRVNNILDKYEVILPYPRYYKYNKHTLNSQYEAEHIASDWETCINVLLNKYPEYKESVNKFFENSNKIYGLNMFISKKTWSDNYCAWLFDILFEVEKKIKISTNPYQQRVFGFLSERLLTLYILHHKFKVKHMQLLLVN